MTNAAPPPAPAARRRPAAFGLWGLVASIALAVLVVATITWLRSEHALRFALDEIVARTEGRLALEDVSGSLAGDVRVGRVLWRSDGTEVVAEKVAVDFSLATLLRGVVAIRSLHADRVAVALPPDDGEPFAMPESIEPPLAVRVDRLTVGTVEIRDGDATTTLRELVLAYDGNGRRHRVRDLSVTAEGATLAGEATVGTRRPFDLSAQVAVDLSAPRPAGRVEAKATGSLEALVVDGTSTVAGVAAQGRVRLAPFAAQPIVDGHVEARDVDLAALDASLPATRLALVVDATPSPGGFTGTLRARNDMAGPVDRNRVPLASATAAFTLRERVLQLADLDVQVSGGGRARGSGTIELDGWRNRWTLAISALDLVQLHGSLRATRLDGRIDADVEGSTQRVSGNVAQDDLALAFDARHDGRTLELRSVRAQARGGVLEGEGRIALTGERPFVVDARASRFDPSRFGAFPAGAIDGTVRAKGTAGRVPVAQVDVAIAPASRLAGLALRGHVRGRVSTQWAEGVDADLALGSTRVTAKGALRRGQPLVLDLASANLAELAPLLLPDARKLAGAIKVNVRLEPRERDVTIHVAARGDRLHFDEWSAATLRIDGRVAHDAPLTTPRLAAIGGADVTVAASGLAGPPGRIEQAKLALTGTPTSHTIEFSATRGSTKLEARARGGAFDLATAPRWKGEVLALSTDGVPGYDRVALAGPAPLEVAANRVTIGAARIEGGTTLVELDGFAWREGRLESRGRVRGLPVAPWAKAAGIEERLPTDLVIGARWDIVSTPAWTGTVAIERERGDVYVDEPDVDGPARTAFGLYALRVDATIDGPRLAAKGELRAKLGGNALVDATLSAPDGHLHPFAREARLGGTVRAHVPSLAALQPWIGTAARVQGQAIAEINLSGQLADPGFSGQLVGYSLRVDMPQHGVHLVDGRLRIVSTTEGLRLEEFVFTGGEGSFTASGTIPLGGPRDAATGETRIAWRAENFRAINHPDRRVIVDGEGTLGKQGGRWLLAGKLAIDEGRVAWRSTADSTLDEDIVVVGRPRERRATLGSGTTPLDIELALDFGRNFHFSAEGLDARLAGRITLESKRGEPVMARGTIRAAQGTYVAFGQRLTIDRGRLIFDGPVANPALDIVALRRNLAVEAGVEITGTVRAPLVRLTSNPPVPDSEKLSWLLTGGPPGTASQQQQLALQAAQAALGGRGGTSLTQSLARNLGLDDISVINRGSGSSDDLMAGQVVAVGKRITNRLYVTYEQGLELASNVLRIEYVLSRFFTLSAFAGTSSGVELRFRRNWP